MRSNRTVIASWPPRSRGGTRQAIRRAGAGHILLRTDRDWVHDIARFVLAYRRTAPILHQPPQGVSV